MDLQELGCRGVDWIELGQDRDMGVGTGSNWLRIGKVGGYL